MFCTNQPGDLGRFETELGRLIEVLSLRQDRQALFQLWERKEFAHIDRDTAKAIAVLTDSPEMLDNMDKYENSEEGGYNMCLAVEEMKRECREEGLREGMREGAAKGIIGMGLDFGLSEADILAKLQQKLNVPLEKAREYFASYEGQMA